MHEQLAQHLCSSTSLRSPKAIHLHPGEHREILGRLEVGHKKLACCTKAAVSLKRVKIEEKLLCRAYRNSPITLFRTVPQRRPRTASFFPKTGGLHPPKLHSLLGTGKAIRTSNFVRTFIRPEKSPLKFSGKAAVGVLGDSRKFSGHRI